MSISRTVRWAAVVGAAALVSGGCAFFESNCGRVASSICTIPGEEATCTWLRGVARDNEPAQELCEKVESDAVAYAKEPGSLVAKGRWFASSLGLRAVGFVGDLTRETPGQKLDKALDKGRAASGKAKEAANDALDAVRSAFEEATK